MSFWYVVIAAVVWAIGTAIKEKLGDIQSKPLRIFGKVVFWTIATIVCSIAALIAYSALNQQWTEMTEIGKWGTGLAALILFATFIITSLLEDIRNRLSRISDR